MSKLFIIVINMLISAVALGGTPDDLAQARAAFGKLPLAVETPQNPLTSAKVSLGKRLYLEKKLSANGSISCASCHGLESFGVDNKRFSSGHIGQLGGRNAPTTFNAALHSTQFWDGRAPDLEAQALGPILNPAEMAMPSEAAVLAVLQSDPSYLADFQAAFPGEADPVTFQNLGKAIGAFERTLLTPSRFDKFLGGDSKALSRAEQVGLNKFLSVGCIACHSGPALGGQMFQRLGVVKPFPTKDQGRFDLTKNESDRFYFKVPSLRNIAKTGPYFHDGSIATLSEAVKTMGEYQLGKSLSDEDTKSIVAFLGSLTGRIQTETTKTHQRRSQ